MSPFAVRLRSVSKMYPCAAPDRGQASLDRYVWSRARSLARRILGSPDDLPVVQAPPDMNAPRWVLNDVNLDVHRGETLGLVGPNGAGKTTLLRIISRITRQTAGRVELFGRVGSFLDIGTGFHDDLSGRDNIYLCGTLLGTKKREIDSKLDEIIAFAGVGPFVHLPLRSFSSGMRLRLGFSVAAHLVTEILVMDEALGVGDLEFQDRCFRKIGELTRSGMTALLVSHDMAAIQQYCHRVVWLQDGRVEQVGDARSVIKSYIASQIGRSGVAKWHDAVTAPGDHLVLLRAVRIVDEKGNTVCSVCPRDKVSLQMDVDVLAQGIPLHPVCEVSGTGWRLRIQDDEDSFRRKGPASPGRYRFCQDLDLECFPPGWVHIGVGICSGPEGFFHFWERRVVSLLIENAEPEPSCRRESWRVSASA